MSRTANLQVFFVCAFISLIIAATGVRAAEPSGTFFPDDNTIALWLFDESNYPHTTITDAGKYEYDLRLQDAGKLVPGKFGRALKVASSAEMAVSYAGFAGAVPIDEMRGKNGTPSGLWGPTVAPEKIIKTLTADKWTCEFWLKLLSSPTSQVTIIDLGQAYEPGFTIGLSPKGGTFWIKNAYTNIKARCSTDISQLADGNWHHIALTSTGARNVRHYLDGKLQGRVIVSVEFGEPTPVPPSIQPNTLDHDSMGFTKEKSFDWRRQHRFNFTIGHDRRGDSDMHGLVDELRISDIVRYEQSGFTPPQSFSRNYGPNAPKPHVANGPPLLFAPDSPKSIVQLGSRKHLFIDDALIGHKQNVQFNCNPAFDKRDLNFSPEKSSWRASAFDKDGKVHIFIPDGYGSAKGITRMRISKDGVNFETPNLGIIEFEGSKNNDYVFAGNPMYAMVFEDLNPNIRPEEKYKVTGWAANRGIYLYLSADGLNWRRNETCMLPLVSGGGAETYWDDQRGLYVDFIKRDASFKTKGYPGGGRRACIFETREILKAWPFNAVDKPYYEGWPIPAVTGEGPVIFGPNKNGQVYRTRAIKYPWAPDTYLAFVWRYGEGERRQVDLGVSRDGVHWKFFADTTWYMTPVDAEEVLSLYGLIRRGDEIWQYADYGGAHGGGERRTYARLKQRLGGFVSIDAGNKTGTFTTRPLTFKGNKLILNVAAKGSAKVAILDMAANIIPGFTIGDCDPIKTDAIRHTVTWNNSSDLTKLTGKQVRLKFQMQDTKLYALQFKPN